MPAIPSQRARCAARSTPVARGLVTAVLVASCGVVAGGAPSGKTMTSAQLTSPLVLRDGQHGFAGEAGTVATIEPDGSFRVARFLSRRVEAPEQAGRLSPEAMRQLAQTLATELVPELPATLGAPSSANPRRLGLTYGTTAVTLILPPDFDLEKDAGAILASDPRSPTARFLRIWTTARGLLPGDAAIGR